MNKKTEYPYQCVIFVGFKMRIHSQRRFKMEKGGVLDT
jgi:hypothetical protein